MSPMQIPFLLIMRIILALSDLHQMRGRVGRSNKKAFCYFITPEYSAMTNDARKRITALEQFTDLGSGFNIAMKDLRNSWCWRFTWWRTKWFYELKSDLILIRRF